MEGLGQLLGFICVILPTMLLGWVIGADRATKFTEWLFGKRGD